MELIPHCLTPNEHLEAFEVWLSLVGSRPLAHPVPYLPKTTLRLHLNTFRGEPAISGFDWHFTPTHSSSQPFVPDTGSVLHPDAIGASTWPWVDHPVSGLIQTTPRRNGDAANRLHPRRPTARRAALTGVRRPKPPAAQQRNLNYGVPRAPPAALPPPRRALFGLAFASAPELMSLNQAA